MYELFVTCIRPLHALNRIRRTYVEGGKVDAEDYLYGEMERARNLRWETRE